MATGMSKRVGVGAAVLVGAARATQGTDITTTYYGGANGSWVVATNWNPDVVPCNQAGLEFIAIVPDDKSVVYSAGNLCTIKQLLFGASDGTAALTIMNAGSELLPEGGADLCGQINTDSSGLFAPPVAAFVCDRNGLQASNGSTIKIPSTTFPVKGANFNKTILRAESGGRIELSSVGALDDAWDDGSGSVHAHTVIAADGGRIDLSGVELVVSPVRYEDHLQFIIPDAWSGIELSGLRTFTTGGRGYTYFGLSNGALQTLPSLEGTMSGVVFSVGSGGVLDASTASSVVWDPRHFNGNATIAEVFGDGSMLLLPTLTEINDAWDDGSGAVRAHGIYASDGALINLSGLETVISPVRYEDHLQFIISDAASTIDLSDLKTLTTGGRGYTYFGLGNGALQTLPSLEETISGVVFNIGSGAVLDASAASPIAWDPRHFNGNATLADVSGDGSMLLLPTLNEINDAWDDGSGAVRAHTVIASDGGLIDLSGVELVISPVRYEDHLQFIIPETSSTIDLSGLKTLTTGGRGYVYFGLSNGAIQTLSSLEGMISGVVFNIGFGAVLDASDAFPLVWDARHFNGNATLVDVSGELSTLLLPTLSEINDAWDDGTGAVREHLICSADGAAIDMSGVRHIAVPVRSEDQLRVKADGGLIDLSSLATVSGNGRFRLEASRGGRILLGALPFGAGSTVLTISGAESFLHMSGDAAGPNATTILLDFAGSVLDIDGSLDLCPNATLSAAPGSEVRIGGDYIFGHTDETKARYEEATMRFDGMGTQAAEVAGLDVSLCRVCLSNSNFAIGRMTIGGEGHATTVSLVDRFDNGNRGGNPEALYVFGVGDGDALDIKPGCTLVLNMLNAYVFQDASDPGVAIRELFPPGENEIEYDEGTIRLVGGCLADINEDGRLNLFDFLGFQAAFGNEEPRADLAPPCGMFNLFDFLAFQTAFGNGC